MAEDFSNNIVDEKSNTTTNTDEVVDDIPENAQNINKNTKAVYSDTNVKSAAPENSLMSIISLILGIFSVICCCSIIPSCISAIIGLVLGIISLRSNSAGKNFALIGVILCSIGLAIFLITSALFVIFGSINAVFEIPATMHSMTM